MMVRLVRACGSKLGDKLFSQLPLAGQARKSLWIETFAKYRVSLYVLVRLVRACGSKQYDNALSIASLRSGS